MAGRNHRLLKQTYRFFASAGGEADCPAAAALAASPISAAVGGDEFDEYDVWGSAAAADDGGEGAAHQKAAVAPRKQSGRGGGDRHAAAMAAASLPVNIPIGRRRGILGLGGRRRLRAGAGGAAARVPLEEARGAASFSVHEGVGRTLKGRDLSRVRNAVWQQTGFQD
ncbi:unnamed protein product [Spirodela intermedia]|uniref:Uncharacterized protein n=1 Tax=Spirodela intermedia TaxID=51605 RepID=A0A7I8IWR6_SPIIN|nr:unnamed protein product [Spirodela intermedia]CAA6662444.1 unnamed protein product [Spirodela intermedia]